MKLMGMLRECTRPPVQRDERNERIENGAKQKLVSLKREVRRAYNLYRETLGYLYPSREMRRLVENEMKRRS